MTSTIADFIEQAWNDHNDDAVGVAARLEQGFALLRQAPDQAAEFAALVEHVVLAHLADTQAMQRWSAMLAPFVATQPALQAALDRAQLATQLLRGAAPLPTGLPIATAIRAHGTAVLGHALRGDAAAARALLQSASALAHSAPADDMQPRQALAACFHNLAAQLQSGPRMADTDALMMEAAHLSRSTWSQAGNWGNVERADYMLSLCAAALGDGAQAAAHARSCLAICEANGADAFERFFGHEALGQALATSSDLHGAREQTTRMQSLLTQIDAGDRAYCEQTLDKLAKAIEHR